MLVRTIAAAIALALCAPAFAAERSAAQKRAFVRAHPCPAAGKTSGRCPGYVVDHIKPLCAGGADRPSNMQWQTVKAAKRKDAAERRQCAAIRKARR